MTNSAIRVIKGYFELTDDEKKDVQEHIRELHKRALEKQGEYPKAIEAYQLVVAKYPGDAIADDALYQVGYVRLRQSREGSRWVHGVQQQAVHLRRVLGHR